MKHKNLALTLGLIFLSTLILFISCKKINDYTTLGGDLIPEVDNINTFEKILDVRAFNDTFSLTTDTAVYNTGYNFVLGHLEDPLFGKTDAMINLELKPSIFQYRFSNSPDSLHIDSIVLVMAYTGTYGDTNVNQTVNVYEIANEFRADTTYRIRTNQQTRLGMLGSRSFMPRVLNDSVRSFNDSSANTMRIRLSDAFGARLLGYDTTTANGRENAYASDSLFRTKFRGFALESVAGKALMTFDLENANTRLAIYYKDDHGDAGNTPTANWDTTVSYFSFAANLNSASAQYIRRNYAGTQLAANSNGSTGTPDNEVYIQSTPGSFATLRIPELDTMSNCIVHRAEIIMEQVWSGIADSMLYPANLYVDAYDPLISTFKTIPYDVTFDASGNPNLAAFGVAPFTAPDGAGNAIKQWRFNLTRYVQNIVNGNAPLYDLRVTMPLYVTERYQPTPGGTSAQLTVPVNGAASLGRVRLHGTSDGSQPGANPRRMRMRIVYSKI